MLKNNNLEALSYFGSAIKKEPGEYYSWLLSITGFSYTCIGEPELGEVFYNKALELEPDNLDYLGFLAHHQQIEGKYEEFLKTINKSLSIRKDNRGLNDLGKAYLLLGEYTKAENAYRQFYSLPKEITYWLSHEKSAYAQVLRKLGKEKEAIKYINEAKDWMEKEMRNPYYDLAKVYSFLGEKKKALEYLSKWKVDWGGHVWVEKDPLFENIKNEPEFTQLVQRFKAEVEELRKEARVKIAKGEFPTPEMIK